MWPTKAQGYTLNHMMMQKQGQNQKQFQGHSQSQIQVSDSPGHQVPCYGAYLIAIAM